MRKWMGLLAVALTLLVSGCSLSDDVEEIFTGKTWHLVSFYRTPDWNNPNVAVLLSKDYNSHEHLEAYNITLHPDGKAVIVIPGCTLQGRWTADGRKRTFDFVGLTVVSGNADRLMGYARKMYDSIRNTAYYRGDSNVIRLFESDKQHFMQFGDVENYPKHPHKVNRFITTADTPSTHRQVQGIDK